MKEGVREDGKEEEAKRGTIGYKIIRFEELFVMLIRYLKDKNYGWIIGGRRPDVRPSLFPPQFLSG